jgi:hypothetical protein
MKKWFALFLSVVWFYPVAAQAPIPVDVFADYDSSTQSLTLYFTNPISGLSTPLTIDAFPETAVLLDGIHHDGCGCHFQKP